MKSTEIQLGQCYLADTPSGWRAIRIVKPSPDVDHFIDDNGDEYCCDEIVTLNTAVALEALRERHAAIEDLGKKYVAIKKAEAVK